jgi:nucleoside-diphosphate-sugar epimerase
MALLERGDEVRALVLPNEDVTWLQERHVTLYDGDVREPRTLGEPMQGADAVFHLAAMMGVWASMDDYRAVNVTGTENVCQAALKAGVRRLVHVSSWTVYGMNLGRPATEDLPLAPLNEPYAVTKAEGDRVVQRLIAEACLPAVIVRPGTLFGPGDRLHFGRIANRIRAGSWITIGSG